MASRSLSAWRMMRVIASSWNCRARPRSG